VLEIVKTYSVLVTATVDSNLSQENLERQLVLALWEGMDEEVFIFDGQTEGLKVIDYQETTAELICPECGNPASTDETEKRYVCTNFACSKGYIYDDYDENTSEIIDEI
jgi:predicted RNA-binding Zn-ribbon protein involved in translation (DUF1610 family)